MFAFDFIRLYADSMFADLVRPPDPDASDAAEARSGAAVGVSAWPHAEAVWSADDAHPDWREAGDVQLPSGRVSGECRIRGEQARASIAADRPAADGRDLGSMRYGELEELVVELAAERARADGRYLAALGELTSRVGTQAAAYQLRQLTRMGGPQARCEARLAEDLAQGGMTDTLDAMAEGRIHMSHAKVIARESPKKHRRSEADFLELSESYPADTVARHTLATESLQVYADLAAEAAAKDLSPVDAELALQRQERFASMRMGEDGMWHLRGRFDFLTGRELNTALQSQLRSLRRRHEADTEGGHPNAARGGISGSAVDDDGADAADSGAPPAPTRGQLTADALSELIAGAVKVRRAKNNLLIIADYDIVNDRLRNPHLDDGTPLSAQMLADHAVDAKVLPAVFSADWSELALGRTRNASDAQRLILAARDGGCIGCELTSEHTQGHHIRYYENGGLTEVPNLASMCEPCHQDLHNRSREIHTPPDGRPCLAAPDPASTDPPDRGTAAARGP